jgi:hypothetical protein
MRALVRKYFHNSSTILPRLEEFGASGLAWGRIVQGLIVEELRKHLVNSAPANFIIVLRSGIVSLACPLSWQDIPDNSGAVYQFY